MDIYTNQYYSRLVKIVEKTWYRPKQDSQSETSQRLQANPYRNIPNIKWPVPTPETQLSILLCK